MAFFISIYRALEQALFNSLTKKIAGNMLFLLLALFAVGGVLYWEQQAVSNTVAGTLSGVELQPAIAAIQQTAWTWLLLILGGAIVGSVMQILFLRYMIVRPLNQITAIFEEVGSGEGDLSRDVPLTTFDEIRNLSIGYNNLMVKLRDIIAQVRQQGVQ
ncbi:MAG: methyl-accepting chemotaxis protein, partial [Desulfuromonas sp.]|nr:methyl-accepting chemotaxis protein [Desulfuromonas sp.]